MKRYEELFDIPLLNWEKCLEGRYEFMRIERTNVFDENDIVAFYNLFDKYIERKGLSEEYLQYIEKQRDYLKIVIEYLRTGDENLLNQIAIMQIDLNVLNPTKNKGVPIGETLTILSKWMGAWIDKKKVTVEDYIDLCNQYEEYVKEQNNGGKN